MLENMKYVFLLLSFLISVGGFLFSGPQQSKDSHLSVFEAIQGNVGKPLYLTPFLERGNIRKAQQMSTVQLRKFKGMKSFSGYFTVNKKCESNLFFWFFPAQKNWQSSPVVLWLQGGPGASSLFGLFEEVGPISLVEGNLKERQYSWNVKNNLLFIDQPVGTGFSFTKKGCYATNETEVSRDLYSALIQFYQLFPSLRKNKLFITGESFGGHYVPSIAYTIHKNNPSAKSRINLSGVMVGNGLMDVMYQYDYSSYLYQLGLVDDDQRSDLQGIEQKMIQQLKKGDWESGLRSRQLILNTFYGYSGNVSAYNILQKKEDNSNLVRPVREFLTASKNRNVLHVGGNEFSGISMKAYTSLSNYIVRSVKFEVEELLEHYPVIFYHGQLDVICAYPMAVNFFRNLQWRGAKDYLQAERQPWCVQDQLAGYFKSAHNLHEVLVRAAGHIVPKDQPLWAFELMTSVTSSPSHDPLRQLRTCGKNVK